jgi:hypothetical protein
MTKLAAALAALLVVAALPAAVPAKSHPSRCYPRGSTTIAKTRSIRVFTTRATGAYVACWRAQGARRTMDSPDGVYSNIGLVRIAGRFVAWTFSEVPACKADCPPGVTGSSTVNVMDVRSGTALGFDGTAQKLYLSTRGAIAWLEPTGPSSFDVRILLDASGPRVLDSGAIEPASFKFDGTTLSWVNQGAPHSSPL